MRTVAAALAFLTSPCAARLARGTAKVNDAENIARLNAVPDSLWVAAPQPFFEGMSYDEARAVLGMAPSHISEHLNETLAESVYAAISNKSIPQDFDARTKWPGLVHPIRDQKQCGSCWAVSASEVLGDRVAIAQGKASPVLSAEDMVSCDKVDQGCGGGSLPDAWKYLTRTGIVTDTCMPYTAGGGDAPACSSKCADSESFTRTRARKAYAINGVLNMQRDIMTHGPIQTGFAVYTSFMSYSSGIYHKYFFELMPEGGHAVKIVGWGIEGATPYWTVANSWGPKWGEQGFFRILKGNDQCKFETMGPPYAGLPSKTEEELIVV